MYPTQKTFLRALQERLDNSKKLRRYLNDKRLTMSEKKILQCWMLLRSCQHQEILQTLETIKEGLDNLVESQRLLIEGITYNNMGNFPMARGLIEKSLVMLEEFPLPHHRFSASYNLFIAYNNSYHKEGMARMLDVMESIREKNALEQWCYQVCQFKWWAWNNDLPKTQHAIKQCDAHLDEMSESTIISYLVSKFIFWSKQEDLAACHKTLEQMKAYRNYRMSANFQFMRSLLSHLQDNSPLYVYKSDFVGCDLLFYQLKVIQGLEENDLAAAHKAWSELQRLDEHIYLENFHYRGDKNLFAVALARYQSRSQQESLPEVLPENKVDAMLTILARSKTPVRKEVLFEKLWGHPMREKSDDDKLKNLLYYIRKNKGQKIVFRKGCYSLEEDSAVA